MGSAAPGHTRTLAPAHEEAPGVHRIVLPTPWVRTVNAYLLEGEPLTLVDTGPGLTAATAQLRNTLATLGHDLEDLELLVVTHHHFDHTGAARRLVEMSGARVAAWAPARGWLADPAAHSAAEHAWLEKLMTAQGVPRPVAVGSRAYLSWEPHLTEPIEVDVPLAAGDVLRAGSRTLQVSHHPGHSHADVVLLDRADGLALTGDHLLGPITSNALLSLPLDGQAPARRPTPLLDYRVSLERTRRLGIATGLGGHGAPFGAVEALVDDRVRRQDARAARLLELLSGGPLTAFALAERLWGETANAQVWLVLSEVLGHLDLLVEAGAVEELADAAGTVVWAVRR